VQKLAGLGGQLSGSAGLMFASRFGAPCIRDRRRRTRLTTRHTCVAGTEGLTFPNRRLPAETRTHARVRFNASTTPACLKVCRPGLGSDEPSRQSLSKNTAMAPKLTKNVAFMAHNAPLLRYPTKAVPRNLAGELSVGFAVHVR
jgi:hypothetical protein